MGTKTVDINVCVMS